MNPSLEANMSVLPISFHDLFGIDQFSEISTSANRRKQLSIRPTALHSGLLSFSDAVFRNVIATPHSPLALLLIFPLGAASASSE